MILIAQIQIGWMMARYPNIDDGLKNESTKEMIEVSNIDFKTGKMRSSAA